MRCPGGRGSNLLWRCDGSAKEAYMFVYHDEIHSLQKRENQLHWTVHMDAFFDHYLKDAPKPEWMDGVPCRECSRGTTNTFYDRVPR